jgi:hypothetical protein
MAKHDGGQAFPTLMKAGEVAKSEGGMSLRDYFAAKMIPTATGLFPFRGAKDSWQGGPISVSSPSGKEQLAKWRTEFVAEAYRLADAMLAERAKGGPS